MTESLVQVVAAKAHFCVQSMGAVRWLTGLMPDDYSKRLVARATFGYLDAFLKLAPQLKNQLKAAGAGVTSQHELLLALVRDYDANYGVIRNKLTAHRQALDLGELIGAWNRIDLVSTSILTDDVRRIYDLMAASHPGVPAYREVPGVNDQSLADRVRANVPGRPPGVRFAVDDLAITRPQTATIIPTSDLQKLVMRALGIIDGWKFSSRLHQLLDGERELQRIVRSLLVLDTINLTDNIFGRDASQPDSLLALVRTDDRTLAAALERTEEGRDRVAERYVREVRNKIAAHVDSQEDLSGLLTRLDSLSSADVSAVVNDAITALNGLCQRPGVGDLILMHGRLLRGFDGVPSRFAQSF